MKHSITQPLFLFLIIVALANYYSATSLYASNNQKEHEFTILIEKTMEGKVILTCLEGCEWDNLEYQASDKPRHINQNGFASEDEKDDSDFLVSITFDRQSIVLEGLTGTRWVELKFTCLVVDQCFAGFGHMGTASIDPGF